MSDALKDVFEKIRAQERSQAPAFEVLLTQSARRRRRLDPLPIAGLAIAAAIVLLAWPRHMEVDTMTLSSMDWRAPTDTLLATPGRDLMRELPDLHESILNLQGSP
jgi:hypothetical protein